MRCTKCVMDDTDPGITFDENGVCNYCRNTSWIWKFLTLSRKQLSARIDAIKENGKGQEYDAIMGLSGGPDSSWALHEARRLGLRVYVVSVDHGWCTPEAAHNLKAMKCDHVERINQEDYRTLQLRYMDSGVRDIDVPMDNNIIAYLWQLAVKMNIRWIIDGTNLINESIMPTAWIWPKTDLENLFAIAGMDGFGRVPLIDYTTISHYRKRYKVSSFPILHHVEYNVQFAKRALKRIWGWKDTREKHWESVFTRFNQLHIQPTRWGIDKRTAHYSSLIISRQMTRDEALEKLAVTPWTVLRENFSGDRHKVLSGLGLTHVDFSRLINLPKKEHGDFIER